jgi:pyruvate carboxylase
VAAAAAAARFLKAKSDHPLSRPRCALAPQADVPPLNGFAIQCRVTSEDPEQNFQVQEAGV